MGKGFNDWIEIFRGGWQTDSSGRRKFFTDSDLDSIVAHHDPADPAPAVVGHPRSDDPAYGWVSEIKRAGASLLAKFRDVAPQFESLVREGRFAKRSVALDPLDGGYRLRHVGWLGAAAPAIQGLAPVRFAAEPTHEFVLEDPAAASILARALRNLRDFLIEKFGVETADRYAPDWDVQALADHSAELRDTRTPIPTYTAPTGDPPMAAQDTKTFTQADLDAAAQAARDAAAAELAHQRTALEAERRARLTQEFQAAVTAAIDAGRLTPAQAEGMVEFVLALPDDEQHRFEFARGAGSQATQEQMSPRAWFQAFVAALPKRVPVGDGSDAGLPLEGAAEPLPAPAGYGVDETRLVTHRKALEYQRQHPQTDYLTAVRAVG
ncbi:MAG: hypothetical protein IT495_17065 [Gammaproteobacteria bacterium]|nr:hypothetical protein [Gammaproteobacteria bacterium]